MKPRNTDNPKELIKLALKEIQEWQEVKREAIQEINKWQDFEERDDE